MSGPGTSYRRILPHWRSPGAVYFVTWRLARGQDALSVRERDEMGGILRHFDGARCEVFAYVIMHDHVHVLVRPKAKVPLQWIIHSWKSDSVRRFHRHGRGGTVWQRDYCDHIVRDQEDFNQKLASIVANPERRWPGIETYPWVWIRERQDRQQD